MHGNSDISNDANCLSSEVNRPTAPTNVCTLAHVTETNRRGYVALCSCGWIGAVHLSPAVVKKKKPAKGSRNRTDDVRKVREYSIGEEAARIEWQAHHDAQCHSRQLVAEVA